MSYIRNNTEDEGVVTGRIQGRVQGGRRQWGMGVGVEGRGSKQKETDGSRKTQRYRALTDERREREGEREGERGGERERAGGGRRETVEAFRVI